MAGPGSGASPGSAGVVGSRSLPGGGSGRRARRRGVAVQAAQYSSSLAMKLIHSSRATGVPKAP
ncbi:hypothetical protein SCATT_37440 [Streptantibioticus cattleyicolor NRRL 8057 = DSM 46488]|uniref:Uncharacterized protein n=1 Tax=Streptantibioticus cattleyicolor (strain ATCC 35852 / DSM 46488 / JCM 4925 / NBRC 14057 / NRRL 8057) TaxID=1003195 RepID=G8X2Y2_STREN|nr:hypothetical protein SCATT_37440 [Streptantibioticus cattleyicolor NRRL 8057 = DSM 46488]